MVTRRRYPLLPACPVTVVIGPPAGGKSTYVAQHAGPADAVLDLDRLGLALAAPGTEHHDYPDHIRRAAMAARRAALHRLTTDPACPHLWLIHGRPDPTAMRTYRHWNATVVVIDPGEAVARRRCELERPAAVLAELDRWYRTQPHPSNRLYTRPDTEPTNPPAFD